MICLKKIYIREEEETCDIIKRILVRIKKIFNIINIETKNENHICYLPIFKGSKNSKYSIKRLSLKINSILEGKGVNTIILSEYLDNNQLLKNYLYAKNINILDGRYLFKCLICEIIKDIFRIKNKSIKSRRGFSTNKWFYRDK